MRDSKDIFVQEFRSRPIAWSLQIVGIIVILLNVWLAGKLVPLAKDLDSVVNRVKAAETTIGELKNDIKNDEIILIQVKENNIKLNSIEKQLDVIDSRLARHLGI